MAIQPRYKVAKNPETGEREPVYEMSRGKVKLDKNGNPRRAVLNYKVEVYRTDPQTKKQQRKVVGTFTRWEDADRANRAAKLAIENGTFEWEAVEPPKVITVADACRTWLGIKKGNVSENSHNQYRSLIDHHIIPAIGHLPIADLTKPDVQDLVNAWRDGEPPAERPLKPRLLELCLMVLRSSLEWQVDAGILPANPATKIVKPRVNKRKKMELWTEHQIERFIAVAIEGEPDTHGKQRDTYMAPLWALCLYEAFRRGEALGLRWRDLEWSRDETECVAHIRQTVIADKNNGSQPLIQPEAKTEGSEKPIQLTAMTIEVLKAHRDPQRFLRKQIGEDWLADDLIVTSAVGTVVFPTNVDHSLKRLCAAAGVPPMNIHALRHMSATAMLRAGVSPALVQQKLRHANIQTTIEVYGHLVASDQASVNTALEQAFSRSKRAATDG